jgi:hypothetical protein
MTTMTTLTTTTSDLETYARNARAGVEGMRGADRKMKEAHKQWIDDALKAAEALYGARLELRNEDAAFGRWCAANSLGETILNRNDRAALIKVGADLPYWRAELARTKSRSLKLIVQREPPPGVSPPVKHPSRRKPGAAALSTAATLPRISASEVIKKVLPLFSRLKATYFGKHGDGVLFIDLNELAKIADDAKNLLGGWGDEVLTDKLGPLFDAVRSRSQGHDDRSNADLMAVTSQGLRLLDDWSPGCVGRAQAAADRAEVKTLRKKVKTLHERLRNRVAELEEENERLKSDLEAQRARRPSPSAALS